MYGWAHAASNSNGYTYTKRHPYAERNHPSYTNSNADRLPSLSAGMHDTINTSVPHPNTFTNPSADA